MTYGPYFALPVSNTQQTAATRADLAASSYGLRPIQTVFVQGYSVAGDKGAAIYQKVGSEPTHAGKVQSADGQWWELDTETPNPYMFGAVGDGVADDWTALQNLLNYAGAKSGIAYLTKGNFGITSEILDVPNYVKVQGEGRSSLISRLKDMPVPVFWMTGKVGIELSNFTIFKPILLTSTTTNAITASGSLTFTVSEDASTGTFPYTAGSYITIKPSTSVSPQGSSGNFMIGIVSSYTGTTLVVAPYAAAGGGTFSSWDIATYAGLNAAIALTDCYYSNINKMYVAGQSFYVGIVSLRGTEDVIRNCQVDGSWNRGIYLYAFSGTSRGCFVQDNIVNGQGFTDYLINCNGSTNGTIDSATITGNYLGVGCGDAIVVGGSMSYSTISANTIDNVLGLQNGVYAGNGISVEAANTYQPFANVVTGNMIRAGLNVGIFVLGAKNTTVTGNNMFAGAIGINVIPSGTYDVIYTTVSGNNISYATYGINIGGATATSQGHAVTGNVVSNCTNGLNVSSAVDRAAIVGNVFYGNTTNYINASTNKPTSTDAFNVIA